MASVYCSLQGGDFRISIYRFTHLHFEELTKQCKIKMCCDPGLNDNENSKMQELRL